MDSCYFLAILQGEKKSINERWERDNEAADVSKVELFLLLFRDMCSLYGQNNSEIYTYLRAEFIYKLTLSQLMINQNVIKWQEKLYCIYIYIYIYIYFGYK